MKVFQTEIKILTIYMKRNLIEAIYDFKIYKNKLKIYVYFILILSALQSKQQVSEHVYTALPVGGLKSIIELISVL